MHKHKQARGRRNLIVAVVAIVVAIGSLSLVGANAAGLIGSPGVKDNSLRSVDLRNAGDGNGVGVRPQDTSQWIQNQLDRVGILRDDLNTNGDVDDDQTRRLNDLESAHADGPYGADLPGQDSSSTTLPANRTTTVWTACAPGEHATGGGFRYGDLANESFSAGPDSTYGQGLGDLLVVASEPAYYKDGALVNGSLEAPVNDNLSFEPNAWAVTIHNHTDVDAVARAWVVCQ